mmetsp:Transcript_11847/g.37422  ORF Transcript_11847/g.37422 Transcript_11847/m.37422 type:complete len:273 (+) Transcript_11847:658-1476(+)
MEAASVWTRAALDRQIQRKGEVNPIERRDTKSGGSLSKSYFYGSHCMQMSERTARAKTSTSHHIIIRSERAREHGEARGDPSLVNPAHLGANQMAGGAADEDAAGGGAQVGRVDAQLRDGVAAVDLSGAHEDRRRRLWLDAPHEDVRRPLRARQLAQRGRERGPEEVVAAALSLRLHHVLARVGGRGAHRLRGLALRGRRVVRRRLVARQRPKAGKDTPHRLGLSRRDEPLELARERELLLHLLRAGELVRGARAFDGERALQEEAGGPLLV